MNKGELINAFAAAHKVKNADAKAAVETFANLISTALKDGKEVTIPGVGKLKVKTRPARAGRNPANGETIQVPAKRVVKFSPASEFNSDFAVVPTETV
jgi:DNA-binding protein HU-beta